MLHLGIIGTGRIARIHLDTLKDLPGIRIAALCDLDPSALALAAKRVTNLSPGTDLRLCRDPAELLELPLDGLLICTPNDTHKDLAVAALAAGKPVFCEKPMALSVRDSLAMARESRSRGLPLQVGHNYRHSDIFQKAAEIAGSGRLGELTLIVVRNFRGTWTTGWRFEEVTSGGPMFDDNIHFFDLFNWFSGSHPIRVRCFKHGEMRPAAAPLTRSGQERSLVTVEYDSGLVANLLFCAPTAYRAEVEVVGTEGRLEIGLGPCRLVLRQGKNTTEIPVSSGDLGFLGEHQAFAALIRGERKHPVPSCNDGARAVALAAAANRSITEKGAVEWRDVWPEALPDRSRKVETGTRAEPRMGIVNPINPELPLEEEAALARSLGFGGYQLRYDFLSRRFPDPRVAGEFFRSRGLELAALGGYFDLIPSSGAGAEVLARAFSLLRYAAEAGCPLVVTKAGSLPRTAERMDLLAERFRILAEAAEDLGIRLAVENGPGTLASSAQEALQLLEKVNSSRMGVALDPANLYLGAAEEPSRAAGILDGRILLCHFKDLGRGPKGGWIHPVPGEGIVPASTLLSTLHTIGFNGWILVEYEGKGPRREALTRGRAFLQASWPWGNRGEGQEVGG